MKKIITLCFLLALVCVKGWGQAANYTFATSTGGALTTMTGATPLISTGQDDAVASTTLPFAFVFAGVTYAANSTLTVSSNGFLVLGATTNTQSNNALDGSTNYPILAPMWDDLTTGSNGGVSSLVSGSPGSRKLTIEWKVNNFATGSTSAAISKTFQLWLFEGTSVAQFVYGSFSSATPSASVGIASSSSSFQSVTVSSNTSSNSTANNSNNIIPSPSTGGRIYTFTPPVPPSNDDCSGAVTLTPGTTCSNTSGTNVNATLSTGFPTTTSCTPTGASNDVWYKFTADGVSTYTISVAPATNSGRWSVYVYNGACGGFTSVASCTEASTSGGTATPNASSLSAGTHYYRLFSRNGNTDAFTTCVTYTTPAPTISGFNPTSGCVGSSVNITGTNFTPTSTVKFNGTTATSVTVNSTLSITAIVPTSATTGAITVTTTGGTATSATFTVPVATITNFTPTSGQAGTSVTITGTNFTNASAVTFNNVAATSFTVTDAAHITAVAPAGVTTGPIRVTDQCGNVITSSGSFAVPPTITSISPTSGCIGSSVTITGTNFINNGTVTVKFNGITATSVTVNNATSITAVVPAGATTGVISVATSLGGTATSASFTVNPFPTTSAPGSNQTICTGTSTTLSANAPTFGTGVWSVAGPSTSTGQFSDINSPTAIFTPAGGAGAYTLTWTITNGCGSSANSISITVNAPPTFSGNPVNTSICAGGGNATFSATATASATISYQWQYSPDGTSGWAATNNTPANITYTNSTSATLTVTPNTNAAAGTYYYRNTATVPGCTATPVPTSAASLTVNRAPAITTQPASTQTTCVGSSVTFSVVASGTSPTYQWKKDGVSIPGAINPSYTINPVGTTDAGTYTVVVSNSCNPTGVTSNNSTLAVNTPPSITTNPTDQSTCVGSSTPTTFTVVASGTTPTYSWQYSNNTNPNSFAPITGNGTPAGVTYSGTNTPSLSVTTTAGTTPVGNYYYRCIVTVASCESSLAISSIAKFTVNALPIASISYTGSPYCSNGGTATVTRTGQAGGTYSSAAGLSVNSSSGDINLAASTAGTYTVTYSFSNGTCSNSTTANVTITTLPVATFSYIGTPYCSNGSDPSPTYSGGGAAGTFSATPTGLVFINTSTGQVDVSASTPGTYTVTNTRAAANGCSQVTASSPITITALPAATISYAGSPYCATTGTAPVTRTGTAGGTYTASPGGLSISSSTGDINLAGSTAGTYTVTYTITSGGGCATVSTTASVSINALPTITSVTASPTTICSGGSSNLVVAAPAIAPTTIVNYDFNSGSSYNTLTPVLASNITSSATGSTIGFGTEAGTATTGSPFTTNSTAGNALYTEGLNGTEHWTFTLGGSNLSKYKTFKFYFQVQSVIVLGPSSVNVTYSLNGGSFVNAGLSPTSLTPGVFNFASGIFTLPASVDNPTSLSIRITPVASFGNIGLDNFQVQAVPVTTYAWIASPAGVSAGLPANAGSPLATNNNITVTPTVTTNYTVAATNVNGCTTTANAVNVAVTPLTIINTQPLSSTQTLCESTPISFSVAATGASLTYQWHSTTTTTVNPATDPVIANSQGGNTNTINTTVVSGTTYYYVVVTGTCGTVTSNISGAVNSTAITINTQPVGATYCQGAIANPLSPIASGGSGLRYQWYRNTDNNNTSGQTIVGATGPEYTPPTNTPGTTYYYLVITSSSCNFATATTATAKIIINAPSVAPTTVVSTATGNAICIGQSTMLTVSGGTVGTGAVIKWYAGGCGNGTALNTTSSATLVVNPTTTTTYYARYEDPAPCNTLTTCASITITVNPLPTATISGTTTVCQNGVQPSVTFTGANGTAPYTFTYTVSGVSGNQTITTTSGNSVIVSQSTATPGNYVYTLVSVQDASSSACSNTATGSATVTVNPSPTASGIIISGNSTCVGTATTVIISGGVANNTLYYTIDGSTTEQSGIFTSGGNVTINTPTYSTSATHTYTLTRVSNGTCSTNLSGFATVTVYANPNTTVTANSYIQIGGPVLTLTADNGGGTWSTGNSNLTLGNPSTNTIDATAVNLGTTNVFYNLSEVHGSTTCSSTSTTPVTITAQFVTKTSGLFSDFNTWNIGTQTGLQASNSAIPQTSNSVDVQSALQLDADYTSGSYFAITGGGTMSISPSKVFSSGGTVNFNGKAVTVRSDATGTGAIGQMATAISNATNVTVERYIPKRRAWRMITAPVTGTTIHAAWQEGSLYNNGVNTPAVTAGRGTLITGLTQGTAGNANSHGFDFWNEIANSSSSLRYYDYATSTWINYTDINTVAMNDKPAYMLFVRGDRTVTADTGATTLRATGVLKQGNVLAAINSSNGTTAVISNPYASILNFGKVYQDNSSLLQDKFIIWNSKLSTYGAYETIVGDGSGNVYGIVPNDFTSGGPDNSVRFLQSGEGFFVYPKTGASGNVSIGEAAKSTSATGGTNPYRISAATESKLYVNLNIKNGDGTGTLADGMMLRYDDSYSASINEDDATKQANFYENFGISSQSSNLILEARPSVVKTDTVQIKMWNVSKRSYQVQAKAENFAKAATLHAFLEDRYTGTKQELSLTGDVTSVDFVVNSDTASYGATRFRIVFQNEAAVLPVTLTSVKAAPANGGVNVTWTVANEVNIKQYTVERSTDGGANYASIATQAAKNAAGAAITAYQSFDALPKTGDNLYRIRIESANGTVTYSSVVKVSFGQINQNPVITMYPNPVRGNEGVQLQLGNLPAGSYLLSLYSGGGQTVYQKKITVSQNNTIQTEKVVLNGALAQGSYSVKMSDSKGKIMFTDKLIVAR